MSAFRILRAGTFTDMRGTKVTFGEGDLRELIATYDPGLSRAPLVIGHPAANGPAGGYVNRLFLQDGNVMAEPIGVTSAFANSVRSGRYRKVSAQLFTPKGATNPTPGRWYLQHVGFLGGAAPAVKSLGTVALAADAAGSIALGAIAGAAVPFGVPPGYSADPVQAELVERARRLRADRPGLSVWDSIRLATIEGRAVALGEPSAEALRDRAHALRLREPTLSFWDAFTRVSRDALTLENDR